MFIFSERRSRVSAEMAAINTVLAAVDNRVDWTGRRRVSFCANDDRDAALGDDESLPRCQFALGDRGRGASAKPCVTKNIIFH